MSDELPSSDPADVKTIGLCTAQDGVKSVKIEEAMQMLADKHISGNELIRIEPNGEWVVFSDYIRNNSLTTPPMSSWDRRWPKWIVNSLMTAQILFWVLLYLIAMLVCLIVVLVVILFLVGLISTMLEAGRNYVESFWNGLFK